MQASHDDMRRLATHLDSSVADFEKQIKEGYKTCQFLDNDHMCGVYEVRPHDCRSYVCWNQPDETMHGYAVFLRTDVTKMRDQEK